MSGHIHKTLSPLRFWLHLYPSLPPPGWCTSLFPLKIPLWSRWPLRISSITRLPSELCYELVPNTFGNCVASAACSRNSGPGQANLKPLNHTQCLLPFISNFTHTPKWVSSSWFLMSRNHLWIAFGVALSQLSTFSLFLSQSVPQLLLAMHSFLFLLLSFSIKDDGIEL